MLLDAKRLMKREFEFGSVVVAITAMIRVNVEGLFFRFVDFDFSVEPARNRSDLAISSFLRLF